LEEEKFFFLNIKNSEIKEILKWLAKAMEEVKESLFPSNFRKISPLSLSGWSSSPTTHPFHTCKFPRRNRLNGGKPPWPPRVESAMRKIESLQHSSFVKASD
jgi:hypothetical protein